MKIITYDTTLGEMLTEMLEEGQAISCLSMAAQQEGEAEFVLVLAQAPYSVAIQKFVHMIGEQVSQKDTGYSEIAKYKVGGDGKPLPLED